jgi:Fic family protein
MEKSITERGVFGIALESALPNVESVSLLEEASRVVGEINSYASEALKFSFVVQAMKNAEALSSARIEGTTASLRDLYMEEALAQERKVELKLYSAINYRLTMNEIESIIGAYKKVDLLLLRHLHKLLTKNDPATKGVPGEFRKEDVVIENSKLGNFHPPSHLKVDEFMDRLVQEIDIRSFKVPDLVQAAITHYQFESIHPFRDGNGRTGRMLINAQLLLGDMLRSPILNLSQFFDDDRDGYIARLRSVADEKSYAEWVRYFLTAVKEQGIKNLKRIKQLEKIEKEGQLIINENLRSPIAHHVLRHALEKMYISVPTTSAFLKEQHVASADFGQVSQTNIQRLVELGILVATDIKFGRAKVYVHKKLRDFLLEKE